MTYASIVKAFPAIGELRKMMLPYQKSKKINNLRKEIEAEHQFFGQEEMKLVREYAEKDESGNPKVLDGGRITFGSAERMNEYARKIAELKATESDVEFSAVTLTEKDMGECAIAPETIEALEGFVIFE